MIALRGDPFAPVCPLLSLSCLPSCSELCSSEGRPASPDDAMGVHRDKRYHTVVLSMARQGLGVHDISSLPSGVALPLLDAVQRCRVSPSCDWPPQAYNLIGREDLARMSVAGGGADAVSLSYSGTPLSQGRGGAVVWLCFGPLTHPQLQSACARDRQ